MECDYKFLEHFIYNFTKPGGPSQFVIEGLLSFDMMNSSPNLKSAIAISQSRCNSCVSWISKKVGKKITTKLIFDADTHSLRSSPDRLLIRKVRRRRGIEATKIYEVRVNVTNTTAKDCESKLMRCDIFSPVSYI